MPNTIQKTAPTNLPPAVLHGTSHDGEGAPTLDVALAAQTFATEAGPDVLPPSETTATADAAADAGVAAWHSGVKIAALWSNAAPRNAWASVEGLGWRRVNPANDSAFVTIVALLSHARQMGTTCNLRVENDGYIHEAYAW